MALSVKVPPCYGHLFDRQSEQCAACLLNTNCSEAMLAPKVPSGQVGAAGFSDLDLPTDKKRLILLVCRAYGIPTVYKERGGKGREFEVTEQNCEEFHNLDFLITTKQALRRLLIAHPDE